MILIKLEYKIHNVKNKMCLQLITVDNGLFYFYKIDYLSKK